jgi:hypothetical protein
MHETQLANLMMARHSRHLIPLTLAAIIVIASWAWCAKAAQNIPSFDSEKFCATYRFPVFPPFNYWRDLCREQEMMIRSNLQDLIKGLDQSDLEFCEMLVRRHHPEGSYWLFHSCIGQLKGRRSHRGAGSAEPPAR